MIVHILALSVAMTVLVGHCLRSFKLLDVPDFHSLAHACLIVAATLYVMALAIIGVINIPVVPA